MAHKNKTQQNKKKKATTTEFQMIVYKIDHLHENVLLRELWPVWQAESSVTNSMALPAANVQQAVSKPICFARETSRYPEGC